MSTQTNETPMPTDVPTLQGLLKTVMAKLLAHSSTVQELLQANMDLRAAIHVLQNDKGQLESYIQNMLNPPPAQTSDNTTNADPVSA